MAKTATLAKVSQKQQKKRVFEKRQVFLGKTAVLAKVRQKSQKNTVFEKNLSFLGTLRIYKIDD